MKNPPRLIHTDQPLSQVEFFARANPGRCRARVLTEEHYARYARALEHAREACEAGRGFYRQETGGTAPGPEKTWPRSISRWAVYIAPVSRCVVQVVDRVKVRPGEQVPPVYSGGPTYHGDVKVALACRAALDRSRGARYASR